MNGNEQRRSGKEASSYSCFRYRERRKHKDGYPRRELRRRREEWFRRVIYPSIRGQSCPICFKSLGHEIKTAAVIRNCLHAYCEGCIHRWSQLKPRCPLCNAEFDSWFHRFSLSSPASFLLHILPRPAPPQRMTRTERAREEAAVEGRRTRPLPWRRRFVERPGPRGSVDNDSVIVQTKLRWRASVYERELRAVPLSSRDFLRQNTSNDGFQKERILQRIEPWIQRELQAILDDPDPSIIVHVASSLFIASLGRNFSVQSGGSGDEDDFLAPLRRFLRDWTDTFWHELRCYAENSLTMETYDAVVEYA